MSMTCEGYGECPRGISLECGQTTGPKAHLLDSHHLIKVTRGILNPCQDNAPCLSPLGYTRTQGSLMTSAADYK